MSMAQAMAQEFSHEAAATERVLERVPDDRLDWQPHEKSMSLGRLSSHLAEIPGWGEVILGQPEFDIEASDYKPEVLPNREAILQRFRETRDAFVSKLSEFSDAELMETWCLKSGGEVVFELPRVAAVRSWVMSHQIHHRGQLTVFLRLCGVPLPSVYGPTADEQ